MITAKKIDPRPYQQKAAAAIHRECVPTAPAKSHEYYCCLARWDGSYIGY